MLHPLAPLLLLSLLSECFRPNPVPAAGTNQRSQVLVFRRTALMDTVTATLDGQVVGLGSQQPLVAAVQLATSTTTFQAMAASDGKFLFAHLPAGDYTLPVTYPACAKLAGALVHLGTGDATETTIGMGRRAAFDK